MQFFAIFDAALHRLDETPSREKEEGIEDGLKSELGLEKEMDIGIRKVAPVDDLEFKQLNLGL